MYLWAVAYNRALMHKKGLKANRIISADRKARNLALSWKRRADGSVPKMS